MNINCRIQLQAIALTSLFLWSWPALSNQVLVKALYVKDAFLTGRLLPFAVEDSSGEPVEVLSVTASGGCQSMIDPHRNSILHIYCTQAGTVHAQLTAQLDGKVYDLSVPQFRVEKLSLVSTLLPDEPTKDPHTRGRTLFKNNRCNSCHDTPFPLSRDQTFASFNEATKSVPSMAPYQGLFDKVQIEALVKYINEEL